MIAQPRLDSPEDILRLGTPELFWSVSAGCVDSMVANYTPTNRRRKDDDFTPGGANSRRPDRACIAYSNLIKRYAKGKPIILGGIEASLRRIAHYDMWDNAVRRSVLLDSKADAIVYGMGELSNLEIAQRIRGGKDWKDVRGICYMSSELPEPSVILPPYEECASDTEAFAEMFRIFRDNSDPVSGRRMAQAYGKRYLVHNRPQRLMTQKELDSAYESDYENAVHPLYASQGKVKAMDTVRNSITTHRGCYGDCSFCAIAVHQGRAVVSRSEESILREARKLASNPSFNGIIQDIGGPTANMYGIDCPVKSIAGACKDRRCLFPAPCPRLPIDHSSQTELLKKISAIPGVRKAFVNSGIRYDMIAADSGGGQEYLDELVIRHVSGQMKIAPEHISDRVLRLMGKPPRGVLEDFREMFADSCSRCGSKQYLTYYFIAAHPGCTEDDMRDLADYCRRVLRTNPEQVQIFTPTPSTVSTMMYHCGKDLRGKYVGSEHSMQRKQRQKDILVPRNARKRWRSTSGYPGRRPQSGLISRIRGAESAATASKAGSGSRLCPITFRIRRRKWWRTSWPAYSAGRKRPRIFSGNTCRPTNSFWRKGRCFWSAADSHALPKAISAACRIPPRGSTIRGCWGPTISATHT